MRLDISNQSNVVCHKTAPRGSHKRVRPVREINLFNQHVSFDLPFILQICFKICLLRCKDKIVTNRKQNETIPLYSLSQNLPGKLGQQSAICWNSLGLFLDYSLNHIFSGIKPFIFCLKNNFVKPHKILT